MKTHFFRLKLGDKFWVKGSLYQKQTFSVAVRALGLHGDSWPGGPPLDIEVWPWTKVETCEPVKTRFLNVRFGEKFTHAGKILQKETALRAVSAFGPRIRVTVWPWTRVRIVSEETDPLLFLVTRDALRFEAAFSASSPFLDMFEPGKFPEKAGRDIVDATTYAYNASRLRGNLEHKDGPSV